MELELIVGTDHGLFVARRTGDTWKVASGGLEANSVTSIIAREGVILAGTTKGAYRSDDRGHSWSPASTGLTIEHVRWMAYHPDISDREFAGTEPAAIFVSHDGGTNWRACPEVSLARDANKWFLPYSHNAGCIRGFAFNGSRAYAAAEVGGVLRSDDGGENWRLAVGSTGSPDLEDPPEPLVYPDVHSIEVHPSSPDFAFAATGSGLYVSSDGGAKWSCIYDCYCRAVWVDPTDSKHLVLGPADGVSRGGRIEETRDGGRSWQAASNRLPVPWKNHMVERFAQIGNELFAVLSNGELLTAPLGQLTWSRILADVAHITCVTAIKD